MINLTEDQKKRIEKILDKTRTDLIAVLEEKKGYVITEIIIPIQLELRRKKENEDAEK